MGLDGKAFATLLRRIANVVSKMDETEFQAFASGRYRVQVVPQKSRGSVNSGTHGSVCEPAPDVVLELQELQDRSAGLALLRDRCPTRDALASVARRLDLPGHRRLSRESLAEQIVESTIGYRLRSRAVRGKEKP